MKRLHLRAILALLACIMLAACGDSTATTVPAAATTAPAAAATTAPAAAATTAPAAATTAPAAATTAPSSATTAPSSATTAPAATGGTTTGVTDDTITIGSWGPQTGPAAVYGVIDRVLDGYFKSVNDAGGINGRKIKFIYEDDAYDPSKTLVAVKKLVEQDKVFALVGGLGTAHNVTVMDYLVQNNVPHIAPSTGSTILTQPLKKNIFGLQTTYVAEATILTDYAAANLKTKTIAVFYQNDPFGKEGLDTVTSEIGTKGGKVVGSVSYEPTDVDLSSQALKLQQTGADTLILWSTPKATATILKEVAKLGWKPTTLMSAVNADPIEFALAGAALQNVYTASWLPDVTSGDPRAQPYADFLKKYAPKEVAVGFGEAGMASGQVLVEGLKRAGKNLTREGLIAALETLNNWNDGLPYNVTYTATQHQGQNAAYIFQAQGTKFMKVADIVQYKP